MDENPPRMGCNTYNCSSLTPLLRSELNSRTAVMRNRPALWPRQPLLFWIQERPVWGAGTPSGLDNLFFVDGYALFGESWLVVGLRLNPFLKFAADCGWLHPQLIRITVPGSSTLINPMRRATYLGATLWNIDWDSDLRKNSNLEFEQAASWHPTCDRTQQLGLNKFSSGTGDTMIWSPGS